MSKKKQPPDAAWLQRLRLLIVGYNRSWLAKQCRWKAWRVSQIVGRGSIPNAEDAAILCRQLHVAVEDIWGPDAERRFKRIDLERRPPGMPAEAAAEQALRVAERARAERARSGKGR